MAREIYRSDVRGVVHATNDWERDAYEQRSVPTPALCAQFIGGRLVMCVGPQEDYPTCLACIVRGTEREGRE
jgi:hypothetical protein